MAIDDIDQGRQFDIARDFHALRRTKGQRIAIKHMKAAYSLTGAEVRAIAAKYPAPQCEPGRGF